MKVETPRRSRAGPWRRLRPLRVWSTALDPLSPAVQARLFFGFLVLGLVARGLRFALRFPLWEDECFLAVNLIDAGFAELAGPLTYHQVSPMLFLWAEAAIIRMLGFSELALRLLPFVCSIAALFLFAWLARRTLRGTAAVLALGFFAPAYPGIRYAAEVKQYGTDLFVGLLLVVLAIEWWRAPRRTGWLWALSAVVPIAVLLSYPGVFVAAGVSVWVTAVLWARRQPAGVAAWCTYNVLLCASFAVVLTVSARLQAEADLGFMQHYWGSNFPPVAAPWRLPWWLIVTHASDLLAWPAGGARGASAATFICVAAGCGLLGRRRRWGLLALCLLPAAVHLVAAAMHRYPYGGHVKFSMHLGAAICLLAGIGAAALLGLRRHAPDRGRGALLVCLGVLACVGAGSIARDCLHPYKTLSDQRARAFARWLWFSADFDGDVRCLHVDEALGASPTTWTELSWAAMYLCNQAIYRPDPPLGAQPPPAEPGPGPRRYVLFRDPRQPFDEAVLDRWLGQMAVDHELVARTRYPVPRYTKGERTMFHVDYVETFTFAPP